MNEPWKVATYSSNTGACIEAAGPWRTSSYSDNDPNSLCVEAAGPWHTSSRSEEDFCVETAACHCEIKVRDTKDRQRGTMAVGAQAWTAFLGMVAENRVRA